MKNKLSNIVVLLIVFIAGILILRFPLYVFTFDNLGFYYYLPNLFINKSFVTIDMSLLQQINEHYHLTHTYYQFSKLEDGNFINRFPIGMSVFVFPFFVIGHLFALFTGYPADGFSLPYQWSVLASGVFYIALGFYFIRKAMRFYFDDRTTAIILMTFFLGTNIFYFVCFGYHFPHVYLFTLYALLVYFTIVWHKTQSRKYAAWIGIILGLIMISRYSEIFALLIPLFWGVYNKETYYVKINLLKKEYKQLFIIIAFAAISALPQIIYWWSATGQPVYFAYDDAGSGLNLLKPRFWWVLFSYRKGWLLYSPLMVLSLAGFILLWKKHKEAFYPIFLYFILNFYIIASFSTLISYGFRAFIHIYAVLLIPFGLSVSYILKRKKWVVVLSGFLVSVLIFINIFQAWQFSTGIIDGTRMTGAYYRQVFLKKDITQEDRELLLIERHFDGIDRFRNEEQYNRKILYFNSFEQPDGPHLKNYQNGESSAGEYSFLIDEKTEYFSHYEKRMSFITNDYYAWFRVSMKIFPLELPRETNIKIVVGITHKGKIYKYRTIDISDYKEYSEPNKWYTISLDYLTPELRSKNDNFNVYVWNMGRNKAYIDELMVEVFTID
ncbi:MAG: hypothetical protein R2750_06930 [Bacteroidales bacterium]